MEGAQTRDAVPSLGKGFPGTLGRGSLEIRLKVSMGDCQADSCVTASQGLPGTPRFAPEPETMLSGHAGDPESLRNEPSGLVTCLASSSPAGNLLHLLEDTVLPEGT